MANTYTKRDQMYDLGGIGNTNFVGMKLTGSNSVKEDGTNSYHILVRKTPFTFTKAHEGTLRSYQAYKQFKDICENNPQVLKKGKYKLNAKGQIPKALIDLLGTNKASEIEGVRNLAEIKAEMDSWSKK